MLRSVSLTPIYRLPSHIPPTPPHSHPHPPPFRWILTHDFTHRTHAVIFGFQYPRSLPDWSSDDWVTVLYRQFGLMSKREDATVVHKLHGTRYSPSDKGVRLLALNAELSAGAKAVVAWANATAGVEITYKLEVIECCR